MIQLKNGLKLELKQGSEIDSPDELQDQDAFLVYDHRQFFVDREGFKPSRINEYLQNKEFDNTYDGFHIFKVYAYIHSGVHLSLSYNGNRWDVSSTGFIVISKDLFADDDKALIKAYKLINRWNECLESPGYAYTLYKSYKYKKVYEDNLATDFIFEDLIEEYDESGYVTLEEIADVIDNITPEEKKLIIDYTFD